MSVDLSVRVGKLRLKNPVIVASGTFGYAQEFKDLLNLKRLGAITTKTVTLNPHSGNSPPRIVETPAGLLNSIGLQNEGVDNFIKEKLPFLKKIGVPIIASIGAQEKDEFEELARRLDSQDGLDAIELNISCPNIEVHSQKCVVHSKRRGSANRKLQTKLIAQDPHSTYEVVKAVRRVTKKTLISKLCPNVTDIVEIAAAAVRAGTDALSLINTLYGLSIDIQTRRSNLGNIVGGLSGPAIKPLALYMVYRIARSLDIPIIGMGGIVNSYDALEFILAGATAVGIGTANFINPGVSIEIIKGIKEYLLNNKIKAVKNLIASLRV
jgi:dihydroorotate dehydrogenase (NAD+) catalytic subunit